VRESAMLAKALLGTVYALAVCLDA